MYFLKSFFACTPEYTCLFNYFQMLVALSIDNNTLPLINMLKRQYFGVYLHVYPKNQAVLGNYLARFTSQSYKPGRVPLAVFCRSAAVHFSPSRSGRRRLRKRGPPRKRHAWKICKINGGSRTHKIVQHFLGFYFAVPDNLF